MPLRKPPTMTLRRWAANQANAQRSTGPRTAQGKARSRLNALRTGSRSPAFLRFRDAMALAPPGETDAVAAAMLSPEQLNHPFVASHVDSWRELWEYAVTHTPEYRRLRREIRRKVLKMGRSKPERPLKSRGVKKRTHQVIENRQLNSDFWAKAPKSTG